MQEEGLAKVEATVKSNLLEAPGHQLRAKVCTLIEPLPASSMKALDASTSTLAGSFKSVWIKFGVNGDTSIPLSQRAGMEWILIIDPCTQKTFWAHATPATPLLHTRQTMHYVHKKFSINAIHFIDHIM